MFYEKHPDQNTNLGRFLKKKKKKKNETEILNLIFQIA